MYYIKFIYYYISLNYQSISLISIVYINQWRAAILGLQLVLPLYVIDNPLIFIIDVLLYVIIDVLLYVITILYINDLLFRVAKVILILKRGHLYLKNYKMAFTKK